MVYKSMASAMSFQQQQ